MLQELGYGAVIGGALFGLGRLKGTEIASLITDVWSVWLGKGIPSRQPSGGQSIANEVPAHLIPANEIAFMRIMSSGMSIGFVFVDINEIIRVFNPAAEDIFGYSAEEVIGANLSVLLPDEVAKLHQFYVASYREQRSSKQVSRVVGKTRSVLIKKADGMVEAVMTSVTDVQNGISGYVGLIWRQAVQPVQKVIVLPAKRGED